MAKVSGTSVTARDGHQHDEQVSIAESLVFANDYWHLVMLAKEVATLDVLSNWRVELGLGAGFSRIEYEQAGMGFDSPGFEESLQILKGLFVRRPAGGRRAFRSTD